MENVSLTLFGIENENNIEWKKINWWCLVDEGINNFEIGGKNIEWMKISWWYFFLMFSIKHL